MSKVKICGLSRIAEIEAANRILPDYIGFVFAPSRRRIDIKTAARLKAKLDPRIKAVGVFVNEDIRTISEIYQNGTIDLVQLHGDEEDFYIGRLKKICAAPVIKAVSVGEGLPALPGKADYLLFDTVSGQRGGTGRTFDWHILKEYHELPYFLAGGLSLENVGEAIHMLAPFGVDVSSGVETEGIKDIEKMEDFVRLVRREKE